VLTQLELLHSGVRHKLYRGDEHGRKLVEKQLGAAARDADAVASLRHEYEVLRAVDVQGVVKVHEIAPSHGGLSLVMDDAGDTNLARRAQAETLGVDEFLEVAPQLAEIARELYAAHVVHRNISPSNVVWDSFDFDRFLAVLDQEASLPRD
jgi:serine/threonine protein kinase